MNFTLPKVKSVILNTATEKIASKSSFGIQLGKQMFYEQLKYYDLEDAYHFAGERMACNTQHTDAKQGIHDFVNKKKNR